MQLPFLLAAGLAVVTCAVHVFAGGVHVVRPLLGAADLTPASRWLNYYCWHIVSLLILVIGVAFVGAAIDPDRRSLALLFTPFTGALSLLSGAVAVRGRIRPYRFPSTTLFALICACGTWGLVA